MKYLKKHKMKKTFETYGTLLFDPSDFTKKQRKQASWKKVALIMIDENDPTTGQPSGDLAAYYRWFLERRFNLSLTAPARGSHVTIINDSLRDMGDSAENWENLKSEWNGKRVPIVLENEFKTEDGSHWWLNIPQDERSSIHYLRSQVGLDRPYFGLHMTVGIANSRNIEHSKYIHSLHKKGLLNLDII